ncbi:MAG: 4-(cytidine 5'-diphospho)-2-C-methyl-D-erythritol kinase, partial [Taibaiella sp.]|nr:4-(cytidine 5'-diphospho)-2-C-methyl-D-erythritol kinase [Taibaiella sp.]
MLCFPNCKINLGLYITERRADGYHNLATVFYPVMLRESLEVVPAPLTTLHTTGLQPGGNSEDNLVLKAYRLLQKHYPEQVTPVDIYLHKVIPMGAGLGGGSADGAFMLTLLNDYYSLGLTVDALAAYALQLGSDCPFFIYNKPRLATGRGELMQDIAIDLSGYSLQLVCPKLHVSTRDAFSYIQPRPAPFDLSGLGTLPLPEWKEKISNDFEISVFARYPVLAQIKQQLYNHGAVYAAMTGTGSAIYGLLP